MRYELKSIGIWSFVKISFFMNLVLGAFFGLFYALFLGLFVTLMGNSPLTDDLGIDPSEMSVGLLLIVLPIFFGIMGAFFQTLIMTIVVGVYNLFTKMTGGLILNLDPIEEPVVQHIPTATVVNTPPRPLATPPPPPPPEMVQPVAPIVQPEPVVQPVQPEPPKPEKLPDIDQTDQADNPNIPPQ